MRVLLPGWWSDEITKSRAGQKELLVLLARRLNLNLVSLLSNAAQASFADSHRRFKTRRGKSDEQLLVASGIAQGLAASLQRASRAKWAGIPNDPLRLHETIVDSYGQVDLGSLALYCWNVGIAVVHVENWPRGVRRPDAVCVRHEGRPVILVVRAETAASKLLFYLAHEIGHIALGHISGEEALIDDEVNREAQNAPVTDAEERAADDFALQLIRGADDISYPKRVGSELELVVWAQTESKRTCVDAGHLILSWGELRQDWAAANTALRYLEQSSPAPKRLNDIAQTQVDFENLADDALDHLQVLTGICEPSHS